MTILQHNQFAFFLVNLSSVKQQNMWPCPKGGAALTHQFNWWRTCSRTGTQRKCPQLQRRCSILPSWGSSQHPWQQLGLPVKCCNIQYFSSHCFKLWEIKCSLGKLMKSPYSHDSFSSCSAAVTQSRRKGPGCVCDETYLHTEDVILENKVS